MLWIIFCLLMLPLVKSCHSLLHQNPIIYYHNNSSWHPWPLQQPNDCLPACLPYLRTNSVRRLLLVLRKTSVYCSAHIFNARFSTTWISPQFARPFPSTNWPPPGSYPPIKSNLLLLFRNQVHVYILLYCPTSPLPPPCKLPPSRFTQNTSYACQ